MRPDIKAEWERRTFVRRSSVFPEKKMYRSVATLTARQFSALWRKAERAGMERAAKLIETTFGKNIAAVVIRNSAPKGKA